MKRTPSIVTYSLHLPLGYPTNTLAPNQCVSLFEQNYYRMQIMATGPANQQEVSWVTNEEFAPREACTGPIE